jgi:general secretion pathway protein E
VELDAADLEQIGLGMFVAADHCTVYQAAGCDACMNTGYAGRTGIHELFVLDDTMHRVIMEGVDATGLHAAARGQGMKTLYEDGLRKVVQGVTSMEEILRVTRDQREEDDMRSGAHVNVADAEFMPV